MADHKVMGHRYVPVSIGLLRIIKLHASGRIHHRVTAPTVDRVAFTSPTNVEQVAFYSHILKGRPRRIVKAKTDGTM